MQEHLNSGAVRRFGGLEDTESKHQVLRLSLARPSRDKVGAAKKRRSCREKRREKPQILTLPSFWPPKVMRNN